MISLQELAGSRNSRAVQQTKEYFDQKYVKKRIPYMFVVGDVVLMNIKDWLKDIKNVGVRWIGPCTVVYEQREAIQYI